MYYYGDYFRYEDVNFIHPLYRNGVPWNLTGIWKCDDGGIYYVRQVNRNNITGIAWLGLSEGGRGETFSNVYCGAVQRSTASGGEPSFVIRGNWTDVPLGKTRNSGSLYLQIDKVGRKITVIQKDKKFSGSSWTKIEDRVEDYWTALHNQVTNMQEISQIYYSRYLPLIPKLKTSFETNVSSRGWYTTAWRCNDGGVYYISHEIDTTFGDSTPFTWAGFSDNGSGRSFTNVCCGSGNRGYMEGTWTDVPLGKTMGFGTIKLRVKDGGAKLVSVDSTGGFGGSEWTRIG
ncbi:hypothetical protein [Priestia megaterium]|uniref:hypothetical protein n=1 Tax=Priestia megaterium TaxID=1404 RepID=UPI0035B61B0C